MRKEGRAGAHPFAVIFQIPEAVSGFEQNPRSTRGEMKGACNLTVAAGSRSTRFRSVLFRPPLDEILPEHDAAKGRESDTGGRGAIRYVATPAGRRIRVDSFLIPLQEIAPAGSSEIRLVYYANSPQPQITVNSAGFDPGRGYSGAEIPLASYQDYFLVDGSMLSASYVPDGRYDPAPAIPRPH